MGDAHRVSPIFAFVTKIRAVHICEANMKQFEDGQTRATNTVGRCFCRSLTPQSRELKERACERGTATMRRE